MISDAARQVPRSLLNIVRSSRFASMVLNLILGAPAAFVFARYVFPGKKLSFMFLILSPLVPTVALVTPIYMMLQALGLVGTQAGIILVHTAKALPFTVLILSVFFRKMPPEIFEAAMLDHCSRFQTFLRIARAAGAAVDRRDRPVRLHALLFGVHVLDGAVGRRRDPPGLGGDGGARAQHRRLVEPAQHRRSSSPSCRRSSWSSSSGASSSRACCSGAVKG